MSKTENMTEYHRLWRRNNSKLKRDSVEVDDNSVQCRICNQVIGSKGFSTHLRMHSLSFHEYVKENLGDFEKLGWKMCCICNTNPTKLLTCSKKCASLYRSNNYSGENHVWYGKKHSQKTKDKISKANIGKTGMAGEDNPATRPEVRAKISKTRKDRGVAVGRKNPMYGKTHTPEAIKKIFSNKKMTTPEKMVADWLDANGIEYYHQFFISDDTAKYSFDFKIKNKNILLEIDGDYWHGGPGVDKHFYKVETVQANDEAKETYATEHGYTLLRFWESDLKDNIDILTSIISEDV